MTDRGSHFIAVLTTVALVASVACWAGDVEEHYSLIRAVPDDVLVCVAERHNPERAFLDAYWGEVFATLRDCGIVEDALALVGSLAGVDQRSEIDRLKQRVSAALGAVDWGELTGGEMVFAERLAPPLQILRPDVEMRVGQPPNMVWLFRGGDRVSANFDGLVGILETLADEINRAVGTDGLAVKQTRRQGATVASMNILALLPGAPRLPIAVGHRDDVVLIALGEPILSDVLGLLDESGSQRSLADDPRFKAAFAQLPAAEDSIVFFDMQALLKQLGTFMNTGVTAAAGPGDVYVNTHQHGEASRLNNRAVVAYQQGDVRKALALTQKAYQLCGEDAIVLYNLACFNALLGNKEVALDWLDKAVEGGFYAPTKISSDSDLDSLRDEPRYRAALDRAMELSARHAADDIVINSSKTGEAYNLSMQAWNLYSERKYEEGLELAQQAYSVAPSDSRVLYSLACFHALLEHEDKALLFLEKAVEGGFYCPRHISNDPDLANIRGHRRYEAAVSEAGRRAASFSVKQAAGKMASWQRVRDRLIGAVGILDYIASVDSTEGYTTRTESIAALITGAENRPIYPVFGKRRQLASFDRYLPEETLSFSVSGGIDLGALYTFIEDTFHEAGPKGDALLADWVAFQEQFGFDVKRDIVDWLDGDFVSVTLADGLGSVWLVKVTDEALAREKVAAAMRFLSTKLTELMAKQPALAMLAVHTAPTDHPGLEGFENLHFAMSPQPLVWGVADGHLIFGTSADAVALCLETAAGRHPNIRKNLRAMHEALLPNGPFTSVSLTDERGLGEELAAAVGIVSMVSGMMTMAIPEPEAKAIFGKLGGMIAKLPPVMRKIDFYKSTASYTTFDGTVWHTRGITHYFSPAERAAGGKE